MPRIIEGFIALCLVMLLSPVLLICWLICIGETKSDGIFIQSRVGQHGNLFQIYKFKTMTENIVTSSGLWLRKYKLDELPQLINIILGHMSFVGPRPDIPGYYDQLTGEARKVLELKPGLTSPAAIKYSNENRILSQQDDPVSYNDSIIFPDKVKLNLDYYYKKSFIYDLKIIFQTIHAISFKSKEYGA